ncbi:MAG: ATP-binding cassette domain-containing protein [Chloroflexota bacterium]
MIRPNSVVHQYGVNPALRGVNLQVNEDEFVTLVGPNRAGKSTLMRSVATLRRPTWLIQVGHAGQLLTQHP